MGNIAAFSKVLARRTALEAEGIAKLYGKLPGWLPQPVMARIREALCTLHNAGQVHPTRIGRLVARVRRDELIIPGSAVDSVDFIKSVSYLAHVQWALSLSQSDAIRELAGADAELGVRTRQQRRAFSAKGNAVRTDEATATRRAWQTVGSELRRAHPDKSDLWLAKQISQKTGDAVGSIRAALGELGLKKK
jgi:hypothetical protein